MHVDSEREDRERKLWSGWAPFTRVMALGAAFLLVGVLVVSSSRAAFTDTTDNSGNAFTAGDIELIDDDSGSAMFTITNMEPGDSETDCILVTYQGSITDPSAVTLYSGGYTDSGAFDEHLNLTIDEGTGGSFGNCGTFVLGNSIESGGTVADFDTDHTNYANGAGVWDPSSTPATMTYRITVELDAATPNIEQGESVTALTFVWEVQS
jgi:predicted ribosomally synthesized peptide with SipW-like signal peptide